MAFVDFTLADWLYYLENNSEQEIQLGLTRISAVATRLGLLGSEAKIITVAGTNGKGSTVASLEALYLTAGYQVASYTSPHLQYFNERICINHKPISDDDLCRAFLTIEQAREGIHLSYFEMATLAALWHFKQHQLDLIILEVGMGGRLDATNIMDADLAIITTVDFDHQDYLGHTKDAIGYEKAGILRQNKPFVYADTYPPASVLEQAKRLKTILYALNLNYSFKLTENQLNILLPSGEELQLPMPMINHKAAVAAVVASTCLQAELPLTHLQMQKAMQSVSIPGRQQILRGEVTTIYDVAHNPQAVSLLADFIKQYQPQGKVHAVFSGLKDKDLCGLIKPMHAHVDHWYPAVLNSKRAANEAFLSRAFHAELGFIPTCFDKPLVAYQAAKENAVSGDIILVYGSFLTVSAIMAIQEQEEVQ